MNRLAFRALFAIVLLAGCSSKAPDPQPLASDPRNVVDPAPVALNGTSPPVAPVAGGEPLPPTPAPLDPLVQDRQDRYDDAIRRSAQLQGDGKLDEALKALQEAEATIPGDQIHADIERLNSRIALRQGAERAVHDIRLILEDGKPESAATLAADALKQFGGTDLVADLEQLKRQADALVATSTTETDSGKARLGKDADDALKDNNLRAAVIALEQILAQGADPDRQKQLDNVRARLKTYDDNRAKAVDLRRDPTTLEDALALLQEAAKAWDTAQVHQDIDEVVTLLQKRRERLAVADFEVPDAAIAELGKALSDDVLPEFKARYDLVDRSQIAKLLEELKLDNGLNDDDTARQQLGNLAKARYLVVGSISRLGGLTLNARLIDTKTGLIVQTARVVSADRGRFPRLSFPSWRRY